MNVADLRKILDGLPDDLPVEASYGGRFMADIRSVAVRDWHWEIRNGRTWQTRNNPSRPVLCVELDT